MGIQFLATWENFELKWMFNEWLKASESTVKTSKLVLDLLGFSTLQVSKWWEFIYFISISFLQTHKFASKMNLVEGLDNVVVVCILHVLNRKQDSFHFLP